MFTTDAIVLKKNLIRDNKGFCVLFTKDFGKISTWITESKIKTPIDMGGIVQVQIKVEGTKNTLQSYKIKRSIQYDHLSFIHIQNILSIISLTYKTIPEGVPNTMMYDDYLSILPHLEDIDKNQLAKHLFELKLTKYLGISLPTHEKSEELKNIYDQIDRTKILTFLEAGKKLACLDEMRAYTEKSLSGYLV